MKIGVDFDNTIVCYDSVFYKAALERGLIPSNIGLSKGSVRDYLRSKGKEEEWTLLQGYVYGTRMDLAKLFPGVDDFFNRISQEVYIISHKTKFPYLGPKYDLHEAASLWLKKQLFFNSSIKVFFELTLQEKLQRIQKMQCDYFIDDLPELLNEPNFPVGIKKILFDPNGLYSEDERYKKVSSWEEIFLYICSYKIF